MKAREDIAMVFVSMGAYRYNAMHLVKDHFGDRLRIYAGARAADPSIRVISSDQFPYETVRNWFLPKGFVIQLINPVRFLAQPVVVADLNPRLPMIWVLLLLRRVLRRRTILWGHAFPRKGPHARSERLRRMLRILASQLITYTETQAAELAHLHPDKRVDAAPNSIYMASQFEHDERSSRDALIYVGRLIDEKKPLLMLEAFEVVARDNARVRLIIVGDGPLMPEIQQRVERSDLGDRIQLVGHESSYDKLKLLYSQAIASVSPGYVGLSVTQSFSFGVPMIIAANEPHAPEIEAAEGGRNAVFFRSDDVDDLAEVMRRMIDQRDEWRCQGPNIARFSRARYSAEAMAQGIIGALELEP